MSYTLIFKRQRGHRTFAASKAECGDTSRYRRKGSEKQAHKRPEDATGPAAESYVQIFHEYHTSPHLRV